MCPQLPCMLLGWQCGSPPFELLPHVLQQVSVEERRQADVHAEAALRAAKLAAVDSLLWDTDFLKQGSGGAQPGSGTAAGESSMVRAVWEFLHAWREQQHQHRALFTWQAPGTSHRSWPSCTGCWRWACAAVRCR